MTASKQPRHTVEIVKPFYPPTKAEMEEAFTVPKILIMEVARRVLASVDGRQILRPLRQK